MSNRSNLSNKVYPSMNMEEIAHDRRAIMRKMHRHRKRNQMNSVEHEAVETGDKEGGHLKTDNDNTDLSEGYDSLQQALYDSATALHTPPMDPLLQQSGTTTVMMTGANRRDAGSTSSRSSSIRRHSNESYPVSVPEIPIAEPLHKRIISVFYILLVLFVLLTYFFFLESSKLTSYAASPLRKSLNESVAVAPDIAQSP